MNMRVLKCTASVLAMGLMSGAALADGYATSLKDAPVPVVAPTWSGIYVGGSIGYGWNDSENHYVDSNGDTADNKEDAEGGLVSGIIGIDRQIHDRWVIGAFFEGDLMDLDRGDDVNGRLTIDRAFYIGARAGILVRPTTLLFATAGYTQAHFDNDGWWDLEDDISGDTAPGRDSAKFNGWFVGAGLEHMLGNNFFLRGEVRYADYGDEISATGTLDDGFGGTYDFVDREEAEIWTARLGLVYKLGRTEAVAGLKDGGGESSSGNIDVITYKGVDVSKDVWSLYSGGIYALNGDLTRNGFVARTFGYYADYEYDAGGTSFDGKDRALDAMIGYLHYFGNFSAIGYLGMEVRDIDQKPEDVLNKVRGTETGFKVALELETEGDGPFYFSFDSSYSTAFDSFYGQLRVGANRNGIKFGPEGHIYSDEGDVTSRVGAFVSVPFKLAAMPAEIEFSGGYQFVEDDNNGGGTAESGVRGGEGGYFGSMLKLQY